MIPLKPKEKVRKRVAREANLEGRLIRDIERAGGICWKWTSPGRRGVPDRIVIVNGAITFAELKSAKGGVDIAQRECAEAIAAAGGRVLFVNPANYTASLRTMLNA